MATKKASKGSKKSHSTSSKKSSGKKGAGIRAVAVATVPNDEAVLAFERDVRRLAVAHGLVERASAVRCRWVRVIINGVPQWRCI